MSDSDRVSNAHADVSVRPPTAVVSRNPLAWLRVFGPGAVIASLTIGSGELIFSTRGGALFGYRILFLFVTISILKWALVVASARHIVLTGVHPTQRFMSLPGPRGWFPILLFLMALFCMPVWISFHSGVLGNLVSQISGTEGALGGTVDLLWGLLVLSIVVVLTLAGGYTVLERVQLCVVAALIGCATVTLFIYDPDWLELLVGAVTPGGYAYPDWLAGKYPRVAQQPVAVEIASYVGVIGGAGYDYLAYTTFLRDKAWGRSHLGTASAADLAEAADDPRHATRLWLRAPLIDCGFSFLLIIAFSAVFVASGTIVLAPAEEIPDADNFLGHQARFVTDLHPWLLPLYFAGVFLAMFGTLYGTVEVAHTIYSEITRCFDPKRSRTRARAIRTQATLWCGLGACAVFGWSATHQLNAQETRPPLLLALLTPVNLFTGVLLCGIVCFLLIWVDRRFLPRALRMSYSLATLNVFAGVVFLAIGLYGVVSHAARTSIIGGLFGATALSWAIAGVLARRR